MESTAIPPEVATEAPVETEFSPTAPTAQTGNPAAQTVVPAAQTVDPAAQTVDPASGSAPAIEPTAPSPEVATEAPVETESSPTAPPVQISDPIDSPIPFMPGSASPITDSNQAVLSDGARVQRFRSIGEGLVNQFIRADSVLLQAERVSESLTSLVDSVAETGVQSLFTPNSVERNRLTFDATGIDQLTAENQFLGENVQSQIGRLAQIFQIDNTESPDLSVFPSIDDLFPPAPSETDLADDTVEVDPSGSSEIEPEAEAVPESEADQTPQEVASSPDTTAADNPNLTVEDSPTVEPTGADANPSEVPSSEMPIAWMPISWMPANETPAAEVPATEVPAAEAPAAEAPATEVPAAEVPAAEVPAAEVPATEVPAAEVPAAEIPVAEVPATEVPVAEVPATEVPATEVPAAEVPAAEVPAAEVPAAEVPAAEVPAAEVPAAEVPAAEVPAAEVPAAEVPAAEAPAAEVPAAEVPAAEVPAAGETPSGDVSVNEMPSESDPLASPAADQGVASESPDETATDMTASEVLNASDSDSDSAPPPEIGSEENVRQTVAFSQQFLDSFQSRMDQALQSLQSSIQDLLNFDPQTGTEETAQQLFDDFAAQTSEFSDFIFTAGQAIPTAGQFASDLTSATLPPDFQNATPLQLDNDGGTVTATSDLAVGTSGLFSFEVTEETENAVSIRASSDDFDPVLTLLDSEQEFVDSNDDLELTDEEREALDDSDAIVRDSRIISSLPVGQYFALVEPFNDDSEGEVTIEVSTGQTPIEESSTSMDDAASSSDEVDAAAEDVGAAAEEVETVV